MMRRQGNPPVDDVIKTHEQLRQENQELRTRLNEAEEALNAIRNGEVDALVVYAGEGERVYMLEGADHPYRVMVESIHEGAATLLPDGTLLYCNKRLAEMLSVPLEKLLGSNLSGYLQPGDVDTFHALAHRAVRGSGRAEFELLTASGNTIPVLISMSSEQTEGENVICLVATDLTEQKRSEEILSAERMARSILEQAAEAIVVCDPNGVIVRASQATQQILRQSPLFRPFEEVFPIRVPPGKGMFSIRAVLRGKSFKGVETYLEALPPRRGSEAAPAKFNRSFLLSAAPLRNDAGGILGCIVTLTDVTERNQAEAVLRQRELQQRLMEQSEQERVRLARNLHDGPLQELISLSFTLQSRIIDPAQDETGYKENLQVLTGARESVLALVTELRNVCNDLRPPTLVRFGLARAIVSHTEDLRNKYPDLTIHLSLMEDGQKLPEGVRTALFRIFQECMNNTTRHAQAAEVHVNLTLDDEQVLLVVKDNGVGFSLPNDWIELARMGHFGLVGMKERAEAVGGKLSVRTAGGKGTEVRVEIPRKAGQAQ